MYDINKEAEKIVKRNILKKPIYINMSESDWQISKPETKALLLEINRLEKPLDNLYWESIDRRDFETALDTYQCLIRQPSAPFLSPIIHTESEVLKNESDFIEKARLSIVRAKALLGEEI
jgi:hypothetical protein